jgi:hypothetical protein
MHNAAAEDEFNLYPSAYSPQYLGFAVDNNWGMRRALVSHDATSTWPHPPIPLGCNPETLPIPTRRATCLEAIAIKTISNR